MFRFKYDFLKKYRNNYLVSIHPMFRFKSNDEREARIFDGVSIHPMFRFKLKDSRKKYYKYSCFNTSYVSVQV